MFLAAPILIQRPGDDLGKASEGEAYVWAIAACLGEREAAPGSWIQPIVDLVTAFIRATIQWRKNLFLSLSLSEFKLSNI